MSAAALLAGVRVIDAASFIAGPVATTILADLGADVIKLEPPAGDPYRHRTGGPGVPDSPYNYRWIVDNRTKRGLALDLRAVEGRAVLHRLVERADVFVTNTPLDSRARLGIRHCDYVVSGIPFSVLEINKKRQLLRSIYDALSPTGASRCRPGPSAASSTDRSCSPESRTSPRESGAAASWPR